MKVLSVMVKKPGENAKRKLMIHSLAGLQRIVGGYIEFFNCEHINPSLAGYTVIINEEGMLENLEPNIGFFFNNVKRRENFSGLVGTVIFCKTDEKGKTCSIRKKEYERLKKYFIDFM